MYSRMATAVSTSVSDSVVTKTSQHHSKCPGDSGERYPPPWRNSTTRLAVCLLPSHSNAEPSSSKTSMSTLQRVARSLFVDFASLDCFCWTHDWYVALVGLLRCWIWRACRVSRTMRNIALVKKSPSGRRCVSALKRVLESSMVRRRGTGSTL